jgi:ATP-dependent helicase/nuclease subunit B
VPTEWHGDGIDHSFTFPQLALKLAAPPNEWPLLSEPQQKMLMRHVIDDLARQRKLKALERIVNTRSGIGLVFSFISELKELGVGPKQFAEFASEANGRPSMDRDVALIYAAYQDLLASHNYLDRDAVFRLAMARKTWPRLGDVLFTDGFAEFTPPRLALLQRLAEHVGEMWLSLPGDEDDSERFSAVTSAAVFEAFPTAEIVKPTMNWHEAGLPAGLDHLSRFLFVDDVPVSNQPDGLLILEAPGIVGEVRMVARAIKTQSNRGTQPDSIIVAVRQLGSYADLIDELFTEYGISFELGATLPLSRVPIVAALLQAAAVAAKDWQFADVSAFLRNTLFHPSWPELAADPELPLAADLLIRQLNEPRGRGQVLNAAASWAAAPPQPLEDEEAEKSKQTQTHELAKRCLSFLKQFFALWDDAPKLATFEEHAAWLMVFSRRLGWTDADPALQQIHADLAGWAERERQIAPKRKWKHEQFLDRLNELAALANRPRSTASPDQVRVLPAASAAGLPCDHLYLLGLGERGFPDLSGGPSLYDEAERANLRGIGLDVELSTERLPGEKLLFLRLVAGARQSITFSYPATDEKGQELLPSSFLRTITEDLFGSAKDGKTIINRKTKTMLIEGLDSDEPISLSERRVRYVRSNGKTSQPIADLKSHLAVAQRIKQQRYGQGKYGHYDGILTNAQVRQEIATRFDSGKALSPTALEDYIACPFRFFAGRVLKLSKLEDPSEEIEAHRRGLAYHRALTRLHRGTRLPADPGKRLSQELAVAIGEYADRAGSKTTKILWQLELERLQRSAKNYTAHSEMHLEKWRDFGRSRTEFLEKPYEIMVEFAGKRLKLGGRIDRIDVVEAGAIVGFLVIDYKTGHGSKYTKPAVQRLEHLQLAVYALAAERLLNGVAPLGLLYWLPLENGPKIAMAAGKFQWTEFRPRLESWLIDLAEHIRAGEFPLKPRDEKSCDYCEFHRMCRIAQASPDKNWLLSLPTAEGDADE